MPYHVVSPKTKILLSILFPVMLVSWNLGFDLGAFGTILYRDMITAWIFCVSTFIALLYVRFHDKGEVHWYNFLVLSIPVLWPLIDYLDHHIPSKVFHYFVIVDYVLILLGLLYAGYLFLRMFKNDIFEPLVLRNRIFVVMMMFVFTGLGYLGGHHNYLFFECAHFKLSGDYVPKNCRSANRAGEKHHRTLKGSVALKGLFQDTHSAPDSN